VDSVVAVAEALVVVEQEEVGEMTFIQNTSTETPRTELITVLGPTASGKTSFATQLADRLGGEILSADSRQVYRGMDIGTGKDLTDYAINGHQIPHYLIDIRDAGDKYTLFNYQQDFHIAYADILSRGKTPILCGGTGLYIEAVLKGYHLPDVPENKALRIDMESKSLQELTEILSNYKSLHNSTDVDTKKRAIRAIEIADFQSKEPLTSQNYDPIKSVIIGIDIHRDLRRKKITDRLKKRLEEGMIEEVENLLSKGVLADDLIYYGLEYKYVTQYVIGQISFSEMFSQLEIAIHQFAKRQMTWFRGMERRGFKIHWLDYNLSTDKKIEQTLELI